MAELKCAFVPLVFAELYRVLAEEDSLREPLEDQLSLVDLNWNWLSEAAAAYDRKWVYDLQFLNAGNVNEFVLPKEHAHFATWLLGATGITGVPVDPYVKLNQAMLRRAYDEIEGLSDHTSTLPSSISPTIIGRTLGSVVGAVGSAKICVPAVQPINENVRVAFAGLVEHVLVLQTLNEPWPEMMQTAMYWRGYGLAEALRPEFGGGKRALAQLRRESSLGIGGVLNNELGIHLDKFGDRRNTLSHIADDQTRPRFVDVVTEERQSPGLAFTVEAMTQFVFREVAKEVREHRPTAVRSNAWDFLEQELKVWE